MRRGLFVLALLCAGPVATAADPPTFVGTWSTTYGQMVLAESNGQLSGTYGGKNGITGMVREGTFTFTYFEPGVTGEGEFVLSADGQSFAGRWRPAGRANWSNWTGKRVLAVNAPAAPQARIPAEEPDEPKPVVFRFGNLPPGLPVYFTEGDTDRDGQVGLYEWVQYWGVSEAKLAEYKALDLNGDGLLTAEEYLRWKKASGAPAASGERQPSWGTTPGVRPDGGTPPSTSNLYRPTPGPVVGDPKQVPGVNK